MIDSGKMKDGKTDRPVLYVASYGDVQGSYRLWREGREDPRIPDRAFSVQIYETLASLGRRVIVLTHHPGAKPLSDDFATFIPVRRPGGRGIGYHLAEIAFARRIAAEYRRRGCDGLIVQRMFGHYWPLYPAVRTASFSLLDLHNTLWPMSLEPSRRSRLFGWFNRRTMRSFTLVSSVSPEIARQVKKVTQNRVPTFVHAPQYQPELRTSPAEASRTANIILFAGRIEREKGVFDLLDAYRLLPPTLRQTFRLSFLGDGSALGALRQAVQQHGLEARVSLHGRVGGDAVFEHMAMATVLVCPTQSGFAEGLARTPIEAAIAGVPSVVTEVVPARELLEGAAICVRPGDPQDLATALGSLLSDKSAYERAVAATRDVVSDFFDPSRSLAACLQRIVAADPMERSEFKLQETERT